MSESLEAHTDEDVDQVLESDSVVAMSPMSSELVTHDVLDEEGANEIKRLRAEVMELVASKNFLQLSANLKLAVIDKIPFPSDKRGQLEHLIAIVKARISNEIDSPKA